MSEHKLIEAAKEIFNSKSYAVLYAPEKCFLALFDGVKFVDEKGEIDIERVYEARIFNTEKEFRWLSSGEMKTISDADFPNCTTLDQKYLLWGKKSGMPVNGWTQFAEARIGSFFVPKEFSTEYAQFTAVEYVGECVDGNVAVIDERLTGISEVK